jgi:putative endonuclease
VNLWADDTPAPQNQILNVGELGEQLVAGWLKTQDWVILHHRWRCRWGEIDLIACSGARERGSNTQREQHTEGATEQGRGEATENFVANLETNQQINSPCPSSPLLAFVEVKTRSSGNWDADGLLAITPQKQAKLWQTAQLFLAERPDLANLPCRFDVALVSYQRLSQRSRRNDTALSHSSTAIGKAIKFSRVQLGQPTVVAGYRLILQDYIQSAFD